MRKKILSIAIIALSVITMPLAAGAKPNHIKKEDKQRTENFTKEKKFSKDKKDRKAPCIFEGLNITDAQKEQIKVLNEKQAAEARKFRQERQKADSIQRVDSKKAYLKDLKNILGADKYVEFLENYYIIGQRPGKDFDKGPRQGYNKFKGQKDRPQPRGFNQCPAPAPCPEPCDNPSVSAE